MQKLWGWYKARRWWAKILIALPVLLVGGVALYITIRFGTYQAMSRTTAGEFTPAGAQVVVRCVDGAGAWQRLQKTEAGRILVGKMLRDTALRGPINELLKEAGAPTLNDLDDRRFHDRTHGLYREETILRAAGRDVMAALRMADRLDQTRFCAATKIGFWDYCLVPFATLVPGVYGGEKVDVGGASCIKVQGLFVAFVGPVVVVSDDAALMTEAMKRKGPKEPPPKAARVSITFERSAVLTEWKRMLSAFPAGIASVIADPQPMRKLTVDFDFAGAELSVTAVGDGLRPSSTTPASGAAARWAPAGGTGLVAVNVSAEPIYRWLESAAAKPPAASSSQMERYGLQLMQAAINRLTALKFPSQVLPKVNGPLTVLGGTILNPEGRTFTVAALVFKSDDPAVAFEQLSILCLKAIGEPNAHVQWIRSTESGYPAGHLVTPESFDFTEYKAPCAAIINDTIVFANNWDFLKTVLATAAGEAGALIDDGAFRSSQKRLTAMGLKKVAGEDSIANGWISGSSLREGLEGYFPIWAETEVNTSENMRRLRGEVVNEFHKAGRAPSEDEVTSAVIERMQARVTQAMQSMRDASRVLEYVRFAAFEAERSGDEAIAVRALLSLKSR